MTRRNGRRPDPLGLALLWLSGRTLMLARGVGDPLDQARLRKIGTGVAISTLCAVLSWSLVGAGIAASAPPNQATAIVVGCAIAGSLVVLVFDRACLLAADVRGKLVGIARVRWALIAGTAFVAALKMMTLLFAADAANVAARARERSTIERLTTVNTAFDIRGTDRWWRDDRAEVSRLRQELTVLPAPITAELSAAASCRRAVAARRAALWRLKFSNSEVFARSAGVSRACAVLQRKAATAQSVYIAGINRDLEEARRRERESESARREAAKGARLLRTSGDAADTALNTGSATVQLALIKENPLVAVALLVFWVFFGGAEGMGFIVFALQTRTGDGEDLAASDAERRVAFIERHERAERRARLAVTATQGFNDAAARPGTAGKFATAAENIMDHAAPWVATADAAGIIASAAAATFEAQERAADVFSEATDGIAAVVAARARKFSVPPLAEAGHA